MNPPSNETPNAAPSMELPPPMAEQVPGSDNLPEKAASGTEKAPAAPQAAMPVPPTIPLPMPSGNPVMPVQDDAPVATSSSSLQVSDDRDLIEKEWVNKAKAIVERNRNDPYKQSEELTLFKADYMKKHYNKTIKLNK